MFRYGRLSALLIFSISMFSTGFIVDSFADISFSSKFGGLGTDDDEFDTPTDLVLSNAAKYLYVVDSENDRIQVFELVSGTNCPSGADKP